MAKNESERERQLGMIKYYRELHAAEDPGGHELAEMRKRLLHESGASTMAEMEEWAARIEAGKYSGKPQSIERTGRDFIRGGYAEKPDVRVPTSYKGPDDEHYLEEAIARATDPKAREDLMKLLELKRLGRRARLVNRDRQ